MSKLMLVGGGGHCKSMLDVLKAQSLYETIVILDKPEHVSVGVNRKVIKKTTEIISLTGGWGHKLTSYPLTG